MTDTIVVFLKSITDNAELLTFLSALIPLIELKGAIPVGVSLGMSLPKAALFAYLGSTAVVFPVFFLLIPVFSLLKKIPLVSRLVEKFEVMIARRAEKLAKKTDGNTEEVAKRILMFGLFIFVAVPLPVTGVWTGTAIAVFLKMKFRSSVLPLALGNLVAGGLITLLIAAVGEKNAATVLNVVLILAIVMLIVTLIKVILSKPEEKKSGGDGE